MEINEAIEHLKKNKRNFNQTFDLVIRLKNIDMDNEKISEEINLPNGLGKEVKVGIISNGREDAIKEEKLKKMAKNPKQARKFVEGYDFFFADAPLMPKIGKLLGKYMAPRGKMPKPVPPNSNIKPMVKKAKNSVRIRTVKHPMVQVPVGKQNMGTKEIKENIEAVFDSLIEALPKSRGQIKDVLLKLTMSEAIKLEGL